MNLLGERAPYDSDFFAAFENNKLEKLYRQI